MTIDKYLSTRAYFQSYTENPHCKGLKIASNNMQKKKEKWKSSICYKLIVFRVSVITQGTKLNLQGNIRNLGQLTPRRGMPVQLREWDNKDP